MLVMMVPSSVVKEVELREGLEHVEADATAKIAARKNKEELAIFYCFVLWTNKWMADGK